MGDFLIPWSRSLHLMLTQFQNRFVLHPRYNLGGLGQTVETVDRNFLLYSLRFKPWAILMYSFREWF